MPAMYGVKSIGLGHYNPQIEDLKVKIDDLEKKLNKIVKKKGK